MSEEIVRLPRPALREDQFRRFEPLIARAWKFGTFLFDPRDLETRGRGMNATSFAARMSDAMLGHEMYKYYSEQIPGDFSRKWIRVWPLADGRVQIVNTMKENQSKAANASLPLVSSKNDELRKFVLSFTREAWEKNKVPHETIEDCFDYKPKEIKYATKEDLELILSLEKDMPGAKFVHNERCKIVYIFYKNESKSGSIIESDSKDGLVSEAPLRMP